MTGMSDLTGKTLIKMPTIEEADATSPARAALDALADHYRGVLEERLEGQPPVLHARLAADVQREYYEASKPIVDALSQALAVAPMVFLVIEP